MNQNKDKEKLFLGIGNRKEFPVLTLKRYIANRAAKSPLAPFT